MYIKTSPKKCFLYINENYNFCHQRKTTCTFIYIQKGKNCETFLYTKIQTLCKKQDNLGYVLYIKERHFTLRDFHKKIEFGIYIKEAWQFALRDVFIYKNPDTSQKARQFALYFYLKIYGHFVVRNFSLNFSNWRRGGGIFINKKTICVTFLYAQNNALCVTFLYLKFIV